MNTITDIPEKPGAILIVRLSAIGDCIHCLPALGALRKAFPDAMIGWLVDDRAADILTGHPMIDRLHVLPVQEWKRAGFGALKILNEMKRFGESLRAYHYHVSIDFQGLTKSAMMAVLAGCPVRIGYGDRDGREISRWFNNIKVYPDADKKHVVDRNNALLAALGIDTVPGDFPFTDLAGSDTPARAFFSENGWTDDDAPVMVFVNDTWETKNYPLESLARVADGIQTQLGQTVVLGWGAPREITLAKKVADMMHSPAVVVPPTPSLRQFAALVRRMKAFVGGDTGPMHIAAALGVPCVAIYGGSDPVRNGPYGSGHRVLTGDVACAPCWKHRCPLKDDRLVCLKNVSPDDVIDACRIILQSGQSS